MEKYKFTIVVNAFEKDVKTKLVDTIRSVERQSIGFNSSIHMIVNIVNESILYKVARLYEELYPENVTVNCFHDKNYSLSEIYKNIKGDYVFVMKAGDILSDNALSIVYEYFEKSKGVVDVAAIRVVSSDKRYKLYLKEWEKNCINEHLLTDSHKIPFALDMGVFIKKNVINEMINKSQWKIKEDLCLLIRCINRRKNIAIIERNAYIKLEERGQKIFSPKEFFENIEHLDLLLSAIQEEENFIPTYLQKMVCSEVFWDMEYLDDIMGAYVHPEYDYSQQRLIVQQLLKKIDDNIILNQASTRFKRFFVLNIKYGKYCDKDCYYDDVMLMYENTKLWSVSSLITRIELLDINNGVLTIEGICQVPAGINLSEYKCAAKINGQIYELEHVERHSERYYFEKVYLYDYGFKIEINLDDNFEIEIVNYVGNNCCKTANIEYMNLCPVSKELDENYFYKDGYSVSVKGNTLCVESMTEENHRKKEEKLQNEIRKKANNPENIINLRNYYWENVGKKQKQLWLFMDRPDRADDNGEAFFRFMKAKNDPDIECVFILDEKSENYDSISNVGKVIQPGSEEHKKYHLMSDCLISSQMAQFIENPFNEDVLFLKDLVHRPKFVFLQHGVTHNHNGKAFAKYTKNFMGFISSSERESEYLCSEYIHYSDNEVWLTGMPRFDLLYRNEQKKITIMPTWRKYLTTRELDKEKNTYVWRVKDDFIESDYFKFYNDLINNSDLLDTAQKCGYTISFMPHVIFLQHGNDFNIPDCVELCEYEKRYRDVFAESDLVLTDYTSAVFDFAYLHKPVVYCQFDRKEFYNDHTVKAGYFDFEKDGFGEVCYSLEETINVLVDYMNNNCNLKEKYRNRIDKFFKYTDKQCCERIYLKMKEYLISK